MAKQNTKKVQTKKAPVKNSAPVKKSPQTKKRSPVLLIVGLLLIVAAAAYGAYSFWGTNIGKIKPVAQYGSAAASKAIDAAGGSVALPSTAKNAVTLNVPAKALDSTETISMKEVSAISGLPEGYNFVAGVQSEPSGLLFNTPATATIAIPSGTDLKKVLAFKYEEGGKGFHLEPILKIEGQVATINVSGFTTYGIVFLNAHGNDPGEGTFIEIKEIKKQEIAKIAYNLKQSGRTEPNDADYAAIEKTLTEWYEQAIIPELKGAEKNDAKVDAAMNEMNEWLSFVHNTPLSDPTNKKFQSMMEKALNSAAVGVKHAAFQSDKRCLNNNDPAQVGNLLHWLSLTELNALDGRSGLSSQDLKDKLANCATFELKVTSSMSGEVSDAKAKGTVSINPDAALSLSGSGKLLESDIKFGGDSCASDPLEYTMKIVSTDLKANRNAKNSEGISLLVQLDDSTVTYHCTNYITYTSSFWLNNFNTTHVDELVNSELTGDNLQYLIKDWQIVKSKEVFAKKTYNRSVDGVKEVTTLELIHKPKN